MNIQVKKCELSDIEHLRVLFLHEHELQFIYDKCHMNGWADHYIFTVDEEAIGYGCTWGKDKREDRDAIFEFYILKPFRKLTSLIFSQFQATCKAPFVEYQNNYKLLAEMALSMHIRSVLKLSSSKITRNLFYSGAEESHLFHGQGSCSKVQH